MRIMLVIMLLSSALMADNAGDLKPSTIRVDKDGRIDLDLQTNGSTFNIVLPNSEITAVSLHLQTDPVVFAYGIYKAICEQTRSDARKRYGSDIEADRFVSYCKGYAFLYGYYYKNHPTTDSFSIKGIGDMFELELIKD